MLFMVLLAFFLVLNPLFPYSDLAGAFLAIVSVYIMYTRAIFSSFRSARVLRVYLSFVDFVRTHSKSMFEVEPALRDIELEDLSEEQYKRRLLALGQAILFNRVLLLAARRLENFQRSEWVILPSAFSVILLLLLNAVIYATAYFGIFGFDPQQFSVSEDVGYFDFLYYSAANIFYHAGDDVASAGSIAKWVQVSQWFSVVFVLVILASSFISFKSRQFTYEVERTAKELERRAEEMERHVCVEFRFSSLMNAIDALREAESRFVDWIMRLSNELKS
jgi:hypothetical protein